MKRRYIIFIALIAVVAIAEIVLRFGFGMCDALLYRADDDYEYIAQPSQEHHRFGAHIITNAWGMRSEEPDTARGIVLGLGDSVLFGGTMIDHDSLATTLFGEATGMQMLNIAAGSWGPDNCAAFLRKHGTFSAQAMILVVSSHDAYDCMSHTPIVDVYPNYPSRQYRSAICEAWQRYGRFIVGRWFGNPRQSLDPDEQVATNAQRQIDKQKAAQPRTADNMVIPPKTATFNPGFEQLKQIADSADIPLVIYLHAETGEIAAKQYNAMGREIILWAQEHDVPLFAELSQGAEITMYRDPIHPNEHGQRFMAHNFSRIIRTLPRNSPMP